VTFHGFSILKSNIIVHNSQTNVYLSVVLSKIWGWKFIRKVFGRNGVL
jgi:hypothetical protein